MLQNKSINPIDQEVGARVRHRRKSLGISQSDLADRIGVTFQQVQKYEKGTNRISASRMQQVALALKLPVASFFGSDAETGEKLVSDLMLVSGDNFELNRAFMKIKNKGVRTAILDFMAALADRP